MNLFLSNLSKKNDKNINFLFPLLFYLAGAAAGAADPVVGSPTATLNAS